jgi:CRP/FNR family transcriptional regulator
MFKSLTGEDAEHLNMSKTCTRYRKGQVLFHEGTRPMGVFCVNAGRIKVYRVGQDGKEQIIKISASGDLLGYKALLAEQHYSLSAEALDDCVICFVPKEDFLSLIHPGSKFYSDILKLVCAENNELATKMTLLAQNSVRQRLAIVLLMLKETYGLEQTSEGEIEINLSREDLANIVGTATESLIRLLHDFKEEGLIETSGRKIKVLHPKGLLSAARR